MTEQIRMEPCPFCQGPPCIIAYKDGTKEQVFIDQPQDEDFSEDYDAHVWCHECGAQGPSTDSCSLCIFEGLIDLTAVDVMRIAVQRWNERGDRARGCYDGGEAEGLNMFPRAE